MSPYFRDSDGDTLTYFAWSNNPSVATVSFAGTSATITGVAAGTATVTVTASDAAGLTADQSVAVTVANPDRDALEAFYDAAGGPNWTNNTNWLTNAPLNRWHGVTADSGRVLILSFRRNNLVGEMAPELGSLPSLLELHLDDGDLTGKIPPELGNLTGLVSLSLTFNNLTGKIPPELGNIPGLEVLGLRGNRLTGEIPRELGRLASLRTLWLGGNRLTGEIPAELRNLTALTGLNVASNRLTGEIPTWLGHLTNLDRLLLDRNELTGEIPTELGNLASLTKLLLHDNELTGQLPATLLDLSLEQFWWHENAGLCAPDTSAFRAWLAGIEDHRPGVFCVEGPEAVGTVPAQTLLVGESVTVDVSPYFRDSDGDALAYTAATSNAAVVSAAMSGSRLTLTGVAAGTATVMVTAIDPGGLRAVQGVSVSVSRATAPDLEFSRVDPQDITVAPGGEGVVEFTIRNAGDAASNATNTRAHQSEDATITTSDRVVSEDIRIEALAPADTATVRLRISVPAGATAGSTYFGMCVDPVTGEANTGNNCSTAARLTISGSNRAPQRVGTIRPISLSVGGNHRDDAADYFTDPDGDELSYSVQSSNPGVASVAISGSIVTVTGVAPGQATLTLTAWDPAGLTATQRVAVMVVSAGPIRLTNHGDAGSPAWSPDGDRIAFTGRHDESLGEIYVINANGTGLTRLTNEGSAWHDNAAWAPDGDRIAFASDRDGNANIYIMNADGTVLDQFRRNNGADDHPTWSPDGTRIAFESNGDDIGSGGGYDIVVLQRREDGGVNVQWLTTHAARDRAPEWSPDGTRIAFVSDRDGNHEIYAIETDGSGLTQLTNHAARDEHPTWSPDGTRIAFNSYRDGNHEIYVMNADGTGLTQMTHNDSADFGPAWSPDGTKIAFSSRREGHTDIWVMDAPAADSSASSRAEVPGDGGTAGPEIRTEAARNPLPAPPEERPIQPAVQFEIVVESVGVSGRPGGERDDR